MKDSHAITGTIGLNAAAIIFLYTCFVPKTEFDKLEHLTEKLTQQIQLQQSKIAVLQAIASKQFE